MSPELNVFLLRGKIAKVLRVFSQNFIFYQAIVVFLIAQFCVQNVCPRLFDVTQSTMLIHKLIIYKL